MAETFLMINKEFELLLHIITDKASFILPYHTQTIDEEEVGRLFHIMEQKGLLSRVGERVSPDNGLSITIKDMSEARAIIAFMNNEAMIYINKYIVLLSRDEWRENGIRLKIYDSTKELLTSDDVTEELNKKCICHFTSAHKTLKYKTLEGALKSSIFKSLAEGSENRNAFKD